MAECTVNGTVVTMSGGRVNESKHLYRDRRMIFSFRFLRSSSPQALHMVSLGVNAHSDPRTR